MLNKLALQAIGAVMYAAPLARIVHVYTTLQLCPLLRNKAIHTAVAASLL